MCAPYQGQWVAEHEMEEAGMGIGGGRARKLPPKPNSRWRWRNAGLQSAGNCFEGFRGGVELEGGGRSELRRRNPRRRPWERRRRGGKRSSHHGTCVFIGGSAEAVRQRPWGGVGQRGRPTGQPACAWPVVIVCLDAAYGTWCVRNPHDTCAV